MKMLYDSDYGDKVMASKSANVFSLFFEGENQRGLPIAGTDAESNAAGGGARHDMDGEHALGFFWSPVVDCLSVEQVEKQFPFLYLYYDAFSQNRHGYGKYRGGQGVAAAFKPHNVDSVEATSVGVGERYSLDHGLFGGYQGPTTPRYTVFDSDVNEQLAETSQDLPTDFGELTDGESLDGDHTNMSQTTTLTEYEDDDVISMWMSSGGGYGDALERDPDLVMADLDRGLIDHDTAWDVYRVVYDEDTLAVDHEATEEARNRERATRLEEAVPYDEFVDEWAERSPDDDLLDYYGTWPVPEY
jgi:acetophenone carboxylase